MEIQRNGLFYSPDSFDYIENWIMAHPKDEQVHLWTAAMMTWNFLSKEVEKASRSEDFKAQSAKAD